MGKQDEVGALEQEIERIIDPLARGIMRTIVRVVRAAERHGLRDLRKDDLGRVTIPASPPVEPAFAPAPSPPAAPPPASPAPSNAPDGTGTDIWRFSPYDKDYTCTCVTWRPKIAGVPGQCKVLVENCMYQSGGAGWRGRVCANALCAYCGGSGIPRSCSPCPTYSRRDEMAGFTCRCVIWHNEQPGGDHGMGARIILVARHAMSDDGMIYYGPVTADPVCPLCIGTGGHRNPPLPNDLCDDCARGDHTRHPNPLSIGAARCCRCMARPAFAHRHDVVAVVRDSCNAGPSNWRLSLKDGRVIELVGVGISGSVLTVQEVVLDRRDWEPS